MVLMCIPSTSTRFSPSGVPVDVERAADHDDAGVEAIHPGAAVRGCARGKHLEELGPAEVDVAGVRFHIVQADPFARDQLDPDLECRLVLVENVHVGDGAGEQETFAVGRSCSLPSATAARFFNVTEKSTTLSKSARESAQQVC